MDEWKKPDIGRPYIVGILIVVVLALFGWLYHDHHRNDGINHDTDGTMADIENRIDRIESRVDTLQKRLTESEKTVRGISERIERGGELAKEITTGLGGIEDRIDSAIQRGGRIQNLIDEIERTNK